MGSAAFGYMLPILAGFIAMSIADRPGLAVGFAGCVLAMNGTNFTDLAAGSTTGISGGFLAALLAGSLSMVFGCGLRAPHGGIFVFPVVDHAALYGVALAVGSVVGAVILSLLKKDRTDA